MMFNPTHPGRILKEGFIEENGLSITELAKQLDISRGAFSRVLNEKASISVELALKLEESGISSAQLWLDMQTKYDLAQARKNRPITKSIPLFNRAIA